jgi:hypothetical protein
MSVYGRKQTVILTFSQGAERPLLGKADMKTFSFVKQLLVVEMYDPLGHFVYFESDGGFSYESGRKRNTAQATSSGARS